MPDFFFSYNTWLAFNLNPSTANSPVGYYKAYLRYYTIPFVNILISICKR